LFNSASITLCAEATSQVFTKFLIKFSCSFENVTQILVSLVNQSNGSFNALPTCIDVFLSSSELGVRPQFIAVARSITACVVCGNTSA
jgi:hypothetical protein